MVGGGGFNVHWLFVKLKKPKMSFSLTIALLSFAAWLLTPTGPVPRMALLLTIAIVAQTLERAFDHAKNAWRTVVDAAGTRLDAQFTCLLPLVIILVQFWDITRPYHRQRSMFSSLAAIGVSAIDGVPTNGDFVAQLESIRSTGSPVFLPAVLQQAAHAHALPETVPEHPAREVLAMTYALAANSRPYLALALRQAPNATQAERGILDASFNFPASCMFTKAFKRRPPLVHATHRLPFSRGDIEACTVCTEALQANSLGVHCVDPCTVILCMSCSVRCANDPPATRCPVCRRFGLAPVWIDMADNENLAHEVGRQSQNGDSH